jgi:glycosyltransferase involved in cell wall biosynthesis
VLLVSNSTGIATHVSISGCGVIVEPNVFSAIEGFKSLIENRDLWRDMGIKGRAYALNTLNWNEIAKCALVEYSRFI